MESVTEKKLANGVMISIYDHSRMIAADRWYIKIVCQCSISITDDLYKSTGQETTDIADCIRSQLEGMAKLELVRERNFVDEGEKETVVADIHDKFNDLISGYLSSELFPQKLFASAYDEAKMKCLAGKSSLDDPQDGCQEEPADFLNVSGIKKVSWIL